MPDLKTRLKESLCSGQSWQALCRLRDEGYTSAQVASALNALRAEAANEAEEDRILEVLDIVTGWCAPQADVWDD